MAELTVELGHLIQKTNFELFDFTYSFDDPLFKKELETAIIGYFYFHEIGQETPDRFKHRFMTRFKRIIPYYNQLHNTTLLSYNPLVNYTIKEGLNQLAESTNNQENTTLSTSDGTTTSGTDTQNTTDTTGNTLTTNNTQTTTDGNTTSNMNEKGTDYPDTGIAGSNFLSDEKTSSGDSTNNSLSKNTGTVNNDNTSHSEGTSSSDSNTVSKDVGESESTIVSRGTNKSNYEKTIEGLTGTSYQSLIRQERDNLTRIIDSIIDEMKPCFYLIY